MCDPVCVEGIDHLVALEVVSEALGRRERGDPRVEHLDLLGRPADLRAEVLVMGGPGAARLLRVELEAAPGHLDVGGAVEACQRSLESALADVAPRADDV